MTEETSQSGPEKLAKPKNWLFISLAALLVLLLATTAFLVYQNLQLKKQIQQTQVTPAPMPTPTPDPTANWKTYIHSRLDFEIKYPPTWYLSDGILTNYEPDKYFGKPGIPEEAIAKCDFAKYNPKDGTITNEQKIIDNEIKVFKGIAKDTSGIVGGPGLGDSALFLVEDNIHEPIGLLCYFYDEIFEKDIIDILSTFEFLD